MPTASPFPASPLQSLDRDGFAIAHNVVSAGFVHAAIDALEQTERDAATRRRQGTTFAIRNLFDASPSIRRLVDNSTLPEFVKAILGQDAFVTRAILFDKSAGANWSVPWHQDTTIAVRDRVEAPGFGPWSLKEGIDHVQPPAGVLEGMITARIHLDPCDEHNGALKVIAGSHRKGILDNQRLLDIRSWHEEVICPVRAGGALFMRPLLLHASSRAVNMTRRRVIHLEFARNPLTHGLEWNRA
jgi:ectoine hydroxylase-related dioxygenase (phytanoyl-CoA dioxygenase family)